MKNPLLYGAIAATLIATGGMALAQDAPSTTTPQTTQMMPMNQHARMGGHPDGMRDGMHGRMGHHGPAGAAIRDLRELSRLYMMEGKTRQLEGLYKDVLARTRNQMVRNYAYSALARIQARPRDTSAAIATLRKSLNENIDKLNAMPEYPASKR